MASQQDISAPTRMDREAKNKDLELSPSHNTRIPGSFGPLAARNKLTYDWEAVDTGLPQRQRVERRHDQAKGNQSLAYLTPNSSSSRAHTRTPHGEGW